MQINDNTSERLGASLEALNARIARLAIGLGVRLDDQLAVNNLMAQPQEVHVANERRATKSDVNVRYAGPSGDRRVAHQREELRGLLVLRYHMETVSVTDNGLTMTRQILKQAEEHLVRQGFRPGADGLGLDDFFNAD
jgi:hypothetical protein